MSGIDLQINNLEKIDLSGADILRITENKCNVISYDNLQNVNSIDDLLGAYGACIILYTTKSNFGHWTTLMKIDDDLLEFFDPYGYSVDEELQIIDKLHLRKDGRYNNPHLTALINQSKYKVKVNKNQVQKEASDMNTCGRWASLRVKLRHYSLDKFINLMCNNNYYDGDFWVSALTLMI